jgi:DNA primase catalytic core
LGADVQELYWRLLAREYQRELFANLEGQKAAKGGRETTATCPFCGKADHFQFSSEKPVWRCWHCNKAGDWLAYLQEKQGLEFREALQLLAERAGVEIAGADRERWQAYQQRASVLEAAQELFVQWLQEPEGEPVRQYLEARGYTRQEIEDMELGAYVGGQERLRTALAKAGYDSPEIRDSGLLTSGFGTTHTLACLWRDQAGRATGLVCRAIEDSVEPKYKYSQGLQKDQGLIGLTRHRRAKAIILVEGVLDALYGTAQGFPVVATGGTSLSSGQIKLLQDNGTRELLLFLDGDNPGQEATARIIEQLRGTLLRAYVVPVVEDYKDLDQLLRAGKREFFQKWLKYAKSGASWLAEWLVQQHDLTTDRGRDQALDNALQAYTRLKDAIEQRDFLESLRAATGLSEEELAPRLQQHAERASQRHSQEVLSATVRRVQDRASEGDLIAAEEELETGLRRLRGSRGSREPEAYRLADLQADLDTMTEGLHTGYESLDQHCKVPGGALTILAGRPGHGKTTLQLNLLLNLARRYKDRDFFFFSYEEARRQLALKCLMVLAGEVLCPKYNLQAYVNYLKEKRGTKPKIDKAIEDFDDLTGSRRLYLSDSRLCAEDLAATIGHLAGSRPVGAVFVDYLQRVPVQRPLQGGQRYLEIKRVSELLLEQAVTCDVPIILGAQLGRSPGDKEKVRLDNLRESGDIEQDANLVLGLWNETVAKIEDGDQEPNQEVPVQISVLKNRNGVAGVKAYLQLLRPALKLKDQKSIEVH